MSLFGHSPAIVFCYSVIEICRTRFVVSTFLPACCGELATLSQHKIVPGELRMKFQLRKEFATIAFLAVFLVSIPSFAQQQNAASPRYRLIDLGTFGGPNSSETLEFPYINNQGTVVGFADTSTPDPFNPGSFIPHAFRWQAGVLTDLGTLPDGIGSFAIWSNDRGQVVGLSGNGQIDPQLGVPEGIAVLWGKNGEIVKLGTLGGNQSLAGAINSRGQVVGVAANTTLDPFSMFGWATQTRAFLWQKGIMQDLGTLGGPDAGVSGINERGQVAGVSYIDSNPILNCDLLNNVPIVTTHPFFWQNGKMVDIGTLGGSCAGVATINNRGQVAGSSNLAGDETEHPFLWERGKLRDLGTLGGTAGLANWLNDAGEVTGVATTPGDEEAHAFFWKNGVMTDLGTIKDDACSIAHFMNSKGQVVGTSGCTEEGFEVHGFVWSQGGSIIDLNDFVPPGSDLRVTDGETINDRGEIAGSGLLPNGDFHAIVLIPCDDEPDSEGCRGTGQNANATSSGPAPLLRGSAAQSNLSPTKIVTALGARFAHRYHIPSRGTPRN